MSILNACESIWTDMCSRGNPAAGSFLSFDFLVERATLRKYFYVLDFQKYIFVTPPTLNLLFISQIRSSRYFHSQSTVRFLVCN